MKKILKVLVILVLFVLAAVLLSPLWIGPVTRSVANLVVPKKTGTPFRLGAFALNGYTGHLLVGDMQLENPAGCDQRMAATLGKLEVDVDVSSLLSETIVVENVELKDLFVSYVSDGEGRNNFDVILENALGKKEEPKADEAKPAEAKPEGTEPTEEKSDKPAKKVIIDRLCVSGVMVQFGKLTLPAPSFTLTGIGRSSGGATLDQIWSEVSGKVMQSLGMLGEGLKGLGSQAKNLTGDLSAASQQGAVQAGQALGDAAKSAGEAAGKTVESLKGLFK